MKTPPLTLPPDAKVEDAVNLMLRYDVGAVIVVEEGRVAGIFTERDLVVAVGLAGCWGLSCSLREVMTRNVATVRPGDPVDKAVRIMAALKVRHVPVVDDYGRPLGMVSARDIVRLVAEGRLGAVKRRVIKLLRWRRAPRSAPGALLL